MDVRALRWFQQVADGMTLTDLSYLEETTQSGISRALSRLDAEVGAPLLQRTGRRLRLTSTGAAFKQHLDGAMHQLDDAVAAVQQLLDPDSGTVSMAFQPSLGTWLVPDLISSFSADHDRVRFDLVPKRDEHVSLIGRHAAVELELSTVRPSGRELRWHPLVSEPLLLAVPGDHELADREQVDLSECTALRFVTIAATSHLHTASEELIDRAGVEVDRAFTCGDLPTMRAFVAAGLGVAILPRPHGTEALVSGLRYVPIADPLAKREIGMSWPRDRRLLPVTELFRDHVLRRRAAGDLPAMSAAPHP